MADLDEYADELSKISPDKPRRRRRFYLPSGYDVQRLLMMSVTGSALFGIVLGDIWLWRLLYG